MIELSERELCALIRGCSGAQRMIERTSVLKIITITKEKGLKDKTDEILHDPILEEEEILPMPPESATVIAANVGGPFQAEIQRALMDTLR